MSSDALPWLLGCLDHAVRLEKAIKVLRATYPEPHYIIVTPTVEH